MVQFYENNEWLTVDIFSLLKRVSKLSKRKLRLFAVACCRRVWPLLEDNRCRGAVEVAELLADGEASEEERTQARRGVLRACKEHPYPSRFEADKKSALYRATTVVTNMHAAEAAQNVVFWILTHFQWWIQEKRKEEEEAQCHLLRDIFGNLSQSIFITPSWITGTVTSVAQTIYSQRAFDQLPILGDALEEAECDNEAIINHCRQVGPHTRGCWVIDTVLDKK